MRTLILFFVIILSSLAQLNAQWQIVNPFGTPLPGVSFLSLDFVDPLNGWVSTNTGKIIHTSDGGKTWSTQTTGITVKIKKVRFVDALNGWAICDSGKIIHTVDGGINWEIQFDEPNFATGKMCAINSSICWITGKWLQEQVFLKTLDGGINWEVINPPNIGSASLDEVVFINQNRGWFTVVYYSGGSMGSGIFSTTNGGNTWSLQFSYNSLSTDIFFLDENFGWLGGLQYLYKTVNGTNWTNIYNIYIGHIHFIDQNVGWVVHKFPLNGDEYNKILVSSNGGTSFDIQYTGEWGYRIRDFKFIEQRFGWAAVEGIFSYLGGHLLHTTNGGGIFPSPVEDEGHIPGKFVLNQNYPNPFNPSTTISYQIPSQQFVTLKVYDVLGNEVAVLVNEYRNAGSYEVNFNSSNLTSGVYFYTLRAGDFIQTKKMLLLK